MIITTVAYGIALTDEFGEFFSTIPKEDIQLVNKYLNSKTIGFVDFPSEEDPIVILGFETWISKATDLKNFESIWEKVMEQSSLELKELAYKLKNKGLDTEVHFLAGDK